MTVEGSFEWSPTPTKSIKVVQRGHADVSECMAAIRAAAFQMGYTPPRWWQWWRWTETRLPVNESEVRK